MKVKWILVQFLLMVLLVMAMTLKVSATPGTQVVGESSLTVEDQAVRDGVVRIPSLTIAQDGWVVIHDSDTQGNIVGTVISEPVAVQAGTTTDVALTLTKDVTADQKLFAMLHADVGVIGGYEFPGADVPVKNGDDVVVLPFNATVGGPASLNIPQVGANPLWITLALIGLGVVAGTVIWRQRKGEAKS